MLVDVPGPPIYWQQRADSWIERPKNRELST